MQQYGAGVKKSKRLEMQIVGSNEARGKAICKLLAVCDSVKKQSRLWGSRAAFCWADKGGSSLVLPTWVFRFAAFCPSNEISRGTFGRYHSSTNISQVPCYLSWHAGTVAVGDAAQRPWLCWHVSLLLSLSALCLPVSQLHCTAVSMCLQVFFFLQKPYYMSDLPG